MEKHTNPKRFRTGTKVRLPQRYGADGKLYPELITEVTEHAWQNASGIWVCRVAVWPGCNVRVNDLILLNH